MAKKPRTPPPPRKVQAPKQRQAPRQGLDPARRRTFLFGAAIAVLVLREPLQAARLVAAALIVCGLVLIRMQ